MRLSGLLFDLDGTLADTIPVCVRAFQNTLSRHLNRILSDNEIRTMFGPSEEGMLQQVLQENWEQGLETYLTEYGIEHQNCRKPFEGIVDLLELLQERGIRLGIITGKGPRSAEISLRQLQLRPYFELVETGSPQGPVKTRQIRDALRSWSLHPGEVALAGDAVYDIQAAQEAGAISIAAAWAPSADATELKQTGPDLLFHSVSRFAEWIEGVTGNPLSVENPGFNPSS